MKNPLICYERICRMRFGGIANMSLLSPNAHAPDSAKDNFPGIFGVERKRGNGNDPLPLIKRATVPGKLVRSALTFSPRTA